MNLLEPGMTEDNVTIDMLVDKADAFARQLKNVLQDEARLPQMLDSMTGFFSEKYGVDFQTDKDTGIIGGKPIPGCVDSEWQFCLEDGADTIVVYFGYFPYDAYRFNVEIGTVDNTVYACMNTHHITNSASSDNSFEFNVRHEDGFGEVFHPPYGVVYCDRIPDDAYREERRKAIRFLVERYV